MNKSQMWWLGGLLLAFGLGIGCAWWLAPRTGGVAVVDLEEVARQLGRDTDMVKSLQAQKGALMQQLQAAQQQAKNELGQMRAGLGQAPNPDDVRKYQVTELKYQQELTRMQNRANQVLNEHGKQVLKEFRDSARPIASAVAQEKGLTTVMAKDDGIVFAFDSGVDITRDVIVRMKSAAPAATTPAAAPAAAAPVTAVSQAAPETAAAPQSPIIQASATEVQAQ